MIARLRREEGWAAVTAIAVLALIIPIGLATLAQADEQTRQAGVERIRESSFSLSEAALNAQAFRLSRSWPSSSPTAYPVSCTQGSTGDTRCPDQTSMSASFAGTDYGTGTTWTTQVRDNPGASGTFYTEAGTQSAARWDQGGPSGTTSPDGKMWVRAQATVRGRTRTLVALVAVEESPVVFPYAVVTAGWMEVGNNGNKTLVHTGTSEVQVRCSSAPTSGCLDYSPSKNQVSPNRYRLNFPSSTAIPREALDRLRATAQSRGTYYATCPSTLPSAPVVFIETANCGFTGNNTVNTLTAPGLLVIGRGTLSFGGGHTFNGRIYHANLDNASSTLVDIDGNAGIKGAVTVDGNGGVSIGSSGNGDRNLSYNNLVEEGVEAFNSNGIVQGRWREVPSP